MSGEVPWMLQRRLRAQVRWRAHDHETLHGADPNGDHILGQHLSEPDAGVEAFLDDVDETVRRHDIEVQAWIFVDQRDHDVSKEEWGNRGGKVDPDGAEGGFPERVQALLRSGDLIEGGCEFGEEAFARVGQGDASCRALKQPHADALLEAADGVADGR